MPTMPMSSSAASASTTATARTRSAASTSTSAAASSAKRSKASSRSTKRLVLSGRQADRRRQPQARPRRPRHGRLGRRDAPRRGQAEQYARALPAEEGRPAVSDRRRRRPLASSCTPSSRRPAALHPVPRSAATASSWPTWPTPTVRQRLRHVWTDPLRPRSGPPHGQGHARDRRPAGRAGQDAWRPRRRAPTRGRGPVPDALPVHDVRRGRRAVAQGQLPRAAGQASSDPAKFVPMVEDLWRRMNTRRLLGHLRRRSCCGSTAACSPIATPCPLNRDQLDLLIEAAQADWRDVEPAIFGTLLERALDPVERHKLGAALHAAGLRRAAGDADDHRAAARGVGRASRAAAVTLATRRRTRRRPRQSSKSSTSGCAKSACSTRPAAAATSSTSRWSTSSGWKGKCFATLRVDRRAADAAGERATRSTRTSSWGSRSTRGRRRSRTWCCGSATCNGTSARAATRRRPSRSSRSSRTSSAATRCWRGTSREPVLDEHGKPVTHWDGRTTKLHPVTGEEVPDETARVQISYKYINPKKAEWPKADYVVGNPPFIGKLYMLERLGEGYVDAVAGCIRRSRAGPM